MSWDESRLVWPGSYNALIVTLLVIIERYIINTMT